MEEESHRLIRNVLALIPAGGIVNINMGNQGNFVAGVNGDFIKDVHGNFIKDVHGNFIKDVHGSIIEKDVDGNIIKKDVHGNSICILNADQNIGKVAVGAFLSATAGDNSSWLSPCGDFAFGFRQLENHDLFLLSIWFDKIPERTIVWYANGDRPAPKGSIVKLTANSGLVLTSPQDEHLWKSDQIVAGVVAHGVMNDTGNFVLQDDKSKNLWETFKNPTDTMLPGQIIERGGKLFSRQSETDYARGHFQLDFQEDGNLVFSKEEPFHSTATTKGTVKGSEGKQLVFNDSGNFYILRVNGGKFTFTKKERRARDYYLRSTLNSDGFLVQYFLPKSSVGNVSWEPLWSEPKKYLLRS